jgi:hypothetical protein
MGIHIFEDRRVSNQRKITSHKIKCKAMIVNLKCVLVNWKGNKRRIFGRFAMSGWNIFEDKEEESEFDLAPVSFVKERLNVSKWGYVQGSQIIQSQ